MNLITHPSDIRDTSDFLPLAGLNVTELHAIGPVPFVGRLLQSLGATVTRVSPPIDPGLGIALEDKYDFLNANKVVKRLDLKSADDHASLLTMLGTCDVLLEGFRPGVLERLGLTPDSLTTMFPKLVIGRLSGWGGEGDLASRAGHDINYLAISGLLNAIGKRDTPHPPLNVVADFGGGAMHLTVGVLALLVRRAISGHGGVATTSILAGTVGLMPMFYGMLNGGLWNLERENNLLDGMLPFYRVYKTKDEKFVAVGALEGKFYLELLRITNLSTEPRIDPKDQYKASTWEQTKTVFAATFATRTRDEWAALAQNSDACLSPVLDFIEAANYPHSRSNALFRNSAVGVQPHKIIQFTPSGATSVKQL
jgi:alpha-methylacyl-CoA racemase